MLIAFDKVLRRISRDDVVQVYSIQRLPRKKCCRLLQVSPITLHQLLGYYGISRVRPKRKAKHRKVVRQKRIRFTKKIQTATDKKPIHKYITLDDVILGDCSTVQFKRIVDQVLAGRLCIKPIGYVGLDANLEVMQEVA